MLISLTIYWWIFVGLISRWHVLAKRRKITSSWSPKQSATKYHWIPVYTSALSVRLNLTTKLILQWYCHTLAFPYLTLLPSCARQNMRPTEPIQDLSAGTRKSSCHHHILAFPADLYTSPLNLQVPLAFIIPFNASTSCRQDKKLR